MVKKIRPYVMKIAKEARIEETPLNRIQETKEDEGLTGFIGDWEASDIEERFARSLWKNENNFTFREHFFGPARTTPGAIEIDFIVSVGSEMYPIQIDGEYAHKSADQKTNDKIKDAIFDDYGKKHGLNPVERIDGELLSTQEDSDRVVEEKF